MEASFICIPSLVRRPPYASFSNNGTGNEPPRVQGFHAGYLFQPDRSSDELIGVAIFADRESYRKNATDPKQDEWYRSLRALLTEDPRWEDGEIIEAAERT